DLAGQPMTGIETRIDTAVFDDGAWGVQWKSNAPGTPGDFPQYYRHDGGRRVAVSAEQVPEETGLKDAAFPLAPPRGNYEAPLTGAWANPGPASEPRTIDLVDGSTVTFAWYRFVDQPSLQQYRAKWGEEKRERLQALVEQIHRNWPIDRDYLAPPEKGELVSFDPALLVTPPAGMEAGYVPIVIRQTASPTK
ncbi:MAG: hypothetical protein AAF907_18215, partial [Planctomycetota bacterium]